MFRKIANFFENTGLPQPTALWHAHVHGGPKGYEFEIELPRFWSSVGTGHRLLFP